MEMPNLIQGGRREGSAGSGMWVMSPGRACEGAGEGYLGLEMPNLIQGGRREGSAGSGMRVMSPEGLSNGLERGIWAWECQI